MANARGPKRAAYQKAYNARPENIKKRSANNKARRQVEKATGRDLPSDKDVHHKNPLSKGGGNTRSNLQVTTQKKNRGWRKGKSGYSA